MSLLFVPDGTLGFRSMGSLSPNQNMVRMPNQGELGRQFPAGPEVGGFSADVLDAPVVAGLPGGVLVPAGALRLIALMKRLDVWLETAAAVQAWATEQGHPDAVWVDDDDELAVPAELAGAEVPAFVQRWLDDAPDMAGVISSIQG